MLHKTAGDYAIGVTPEKRKEIEEEKKRKRIAELKERKQKENEFFQSQQAIRVRELTSRFSASAAAQECVDHVIKALRSGKDRIEGLPKDPVTGCLYLTINVGRYDVWGFNFKEHGIRDLSEEDLAPFFEYLLYRIDTETGLGYSRLYATHESSIYAVKFNHAVSSQFFYQFPYYRDQYGTNGPYAIAVLYNAPYDAPPQLKSW